MIGQSILDEQGDQHFILNQKNPFACKVVRRHGQLAHRAAREPGRPCRLIRSGLQEPKCLAGSNFQRTVRLLPEQSTPYFAAVDHNSCTALPVARVRPAFSAVSGPSNKMLWRCSARILPLATLTGRKVTRLSGD
jgi:hypothetical protein